MTVLVHVNRQAYLRRVSLLLTLLRIVIITVLVVLWGCDDKVKALMFLMEVLVLSQAIIGSGEVNVTHCGVFSPAFISILCSLIFYCFVYSSSFDACFVVLLKYLFWSYSVD